MGRMDATVLCLIPAIFIAGFVDSIAGGGGLIAVPTYLIAGIPPTLALGTNKCVSAMGTAVSVGRYMHSGRILWPVAIVGIPLSLLGAALGARSILLFDQDVVRKIILIILPIAAALTLLPKPHGHVEDPLTWRSLRLWMAIPPISLALGWYDGFFGPGTGSLLILALYGLAGISLIHSAAVGRLFNLISNIGGMVTFMMQGQVLYKIVIPLGLASIAGHWCGSHLAIKRGAGVVRGMLGVTCALLFIYLLWSYRH